MDSHEPSSQRRRSQRVAQSLPLIIRGLDLMGQPFEERTATVNFNLHGCRYPSKHNLPKNTWITLGVAHGSEFRNIRARVAWIERPHSVREFFQVAVELETPLNIWALEPTPPDWAVAEAASDKGAEAVLPPDGRSMESSETTTPNTRGGLEEKSMGDINDMAPVSESVAAEAGLGEPGMAENPLLRELSAQLERRGRQAVDEAAAQASEHLRKAVQETEQKWMSEESFQKWKEAFETVQREARERLQSEMANTRAQWNELLESSLDIGVNRIAGRLSEQAQAITQQSEVQISERFEQLRQPLLKTMAEMETTLSGTKSAVDEELARAKASLAEIERLNDFSAQVEASTREALGELNRRLQTILDAQTQEMGERAEAFTASVTEKAALLLDTLRAEWVGRTAAEVESKLAPHLERVPELRREFSSREVQMEEGLRLHRERLRQLSENSEREWLSHVGGTLAEARKEFETARQEAFIRWNEELEASRMRAWQAAAESVEKVSQSLEHEARARLQTLVEQTTAAAMASLDHKTAEAKQAFAAVLEAEATARAEGIRQQLEGMATELTSKQRTQIEQAAEVTAAAFGQVLRGISDQEVEHFTNASMTVVQGRTQELESSATQLLHNFQTSADSALSRFHGQVASQLEASLAEGRSALASEFHAVLTGFRSERESHQKDWRENLERLSSEAAGRYQERLDTTCDSWVVSSVRRLNEHGQNVIESLMRSADQALRDSCARFFDGLAETLRERSSFAVPSSSSGAAREAAEAPPPPPPND